MMKRIFILGFVGAGIWLHAQQEEVVLDTIELSPVTAMAQLPITAELVTKKELNERNLGQDMPILLNNATSVVATSDGGNGVGYTSMRLRGMGQNQINVTFNGVPVNDSESHGVFWVDFADVASSASQVLIQRGVGTSSNGAAAFGGSVNLETDRSKTVSFADFMASYGSFNTTKFMTSLGTGDLADGKWNLDARLSKINSDGYIERASSDLFSGALNVRYRPDENNEIHLMNLYGYEETYQAWNGIDGATMAENRRFNYSGAIYNDEGEIVDYYDNQVDNYVQNHLHLYWKRNWNEHWRSVTTLHWTRGLGYYEEYVQGANLQEYRITESEQYSDLVRRQWLNNHFLGGIVNIEGKNLGNWDVAIGLAANQFVGDHYGTVEKVLDFDGNIGGRYYGNEANKTEFMSYLKGLYTLGNWQFFGDLQMRNIDYDADYEANGENEIKDFSPFQYQWTFVNPKAGVNYKIQKGKLYANYGLTHREPTRSDILDNPETVKPETLHDLELGWVHNGGLQLSLNAYYMYFLDQLVLTGRVDDVGNPIRENVGKSYRSGLELEFNKGIVNNKINLFGNLNWSQNRNLDYKETNDEGVVTNLGDTAISYSPEWVSAFGVRLEPVKDLNFTITNKYVSDQYVTNTEVSNGVLDAYFVTDLTLKYGFSANKTQAEFTLLVNNLWNEQYANNGYYWGEVYYFPQAGTNLMAGLQLRF